MLGASYRRRLADDLPRWSERGWVTPEGSAAILASFDERRSTLGLSAVVGGLGAILLGLGVLAFVAANWEEMPRLVRFALLVGGMGASYAVAALLDRRGLPAMSDAAVMLAGFVFAGAIALVGQTYHLSGDFADATGIDLNRRNELVMHPGAAGTELRLHRPVAVGDGVASAPAS